MTGNKKYRRPNKKEARATKSGKSASSKGQQQGQAKTKHHGQTDAQGQDGHPLKSKCPNENDAPPAEEVQQDSEQGINKTPTKGNGKDKEGAGNSSTENSYEGTSTDGTTKAQAGNIELARMNEFLDAVEVATGRMERLCKAILDEPDEDSFSLSSTIDVRFVPVAGSSPQNPVATVVLDTPSGSRPLVTLPPSVIDGLKDLVEARLSQLSRERLAAINILEGEIAKITSAKGQSDKDQPCKGKAHEEQPRKEKSHEGQPRKEQSGKIQSNKISSSKMPKPSAVAAATAQAFPPELFSALRAATFGEHVLAYSKASTQETVRDSGPASTSAATATPSTKVASATADVSAKRREQAIASLGHVMASLRQTCSKEGPVDGGDVDDEHPDGEHSEDGHSDDKHLDA